MERARRRNTAEKRLRVSEIAKLPPGWHEDGGGLRLVVEPDREDGKPGPCRWVLRVTIAGKRRNRGLGPYPLVTLDKARERGDRYPARRPRRPRPDQGAAAAARQSRHLPPGLRGLLREQEKDAIDSKHRQQWSSTIETYVYPKIGDLRVSDVTHADVLGILEPIWFDKAETARRVLQRMELVFKAAIVLGQRERTSPCVGIRQTLGIRHVNVEHLRALPYADVTGLPQDPACLQLGADHQARL